MSLTLNEIQKLNFEGTLTKNGRPFMTKKFYSKNGIESSLTLSLPDTGDEDVWFTAMHGYPLNVKGLKELSSEEELKNLINEIESQIASVN